MNEAARTRLRALAIKKNSSGLTAAEELEYNTLRAQLNAPDNTAPQNAAYVPFTDDAFRPGSAKVVRSQTAPVSAVPVQPVAPVTPVQPVAPVQPAAPAPGTHKVEFVPFGTPVGAPSESFAPRNVSALQPTDGAVQAPANSAGSTNTEYAVPTNGTSATSSAPTSGYTEQTVIVPLPGTHNADSASEGRPAPANGTSATNGARTNAAKAAQTIARNIPANSDEGAFESEQTPSIDPSLLFSADADFDMSIEYDADEQAPQKKGLSLSGLFRKKKDKNDPFDGTGECGDALQDNAAPEDSAEPANKPLNGKSRVATAAPIAEDTPSAQADEKPARGIRALFARKKPTPDSEQNESKAPTAKVRKKHWLRRRVLLCLFLAVLLGVGGVTADVYASTRSDFLWLDLAQLPYKDASILYATAADGSVTQYARLEATQQKEWVSLDEIPAQLQQAFIAIEDKNFYKHNGVSWTRTAFSVLSEGWHAITGNYLGNGQKQGASTITQQLVKNLTLDDDDSGVSGYLRKVREIVRALALEKKYGKTQILEAYLNVISFTGNTAGVQAESRKLFNCPVGDLTLAQCASIAAITKNPYRYDPTTNPETHLERRNYILYEMWQQGYITEDDYNMAIAEGIGLEEGKVSVPKTELTSYFTDKVIEDVSNDLAAQYGLTRRQTTWLLYNGGLRIYTTVDTTLQDSMENAMLYGSFFPQTSLGVSTQQAVYNEDGTVAKDANGNTIYEQVTEYPQAAMVSVGYDGGLKACVGGLGEKAVSRGFNRATDALRQVGSTMKPIGAYALALESNKITWSTAFMDSVVEQRENEQTGVKEDWPQNFSQTYSDKNILVVDALADSINTIAVRVGKKAGVGSIYRFCTQSLHITGFVSKDKDLGPMVLGSSTYGVSPYEMAGAYMMFGNGGSFTTLHSYTSIQNGYGTELYAPKIETKQVLSTDTAYIMNRLLRGVLSSGTAAGYSTGYMDSVGKTGTSSANRDFWFIGLTPYYCTATWYGYDSGFSLNTAHGTNAPTSAWQYVMNRAQGNLAYAEFPTDDSVVQVQYCAQSGGLATAGCPSTRTGYYKADHQPWQCTEHWLNGAINTALAG